MSATTVVCCVASLSVSNITNDVGKLGWPIAAPRVQTPALQESNQQETPAAINVTFRRSDLNQASNSNSILMSKLSVVQLLT